MSRPQHPGESAATMPVRVIRSARRKRTVEARVVGGVLQVRIPAWMSQAQEDKAVADMRRQLAKKEASPHASDEKMAERAEYLNQTYLYGQAQVGSIRWVSNQNTRWGSCTLTTGAIRISHRLQRVPEYVLDSVIIHELVHTFIPNHGEAFWMWANKAPHAERAQGYLEAYQRFGGGAGETNES